MDGQSVRVTGNLTTRDPKNSTVTITYKGSRLKVSTRLIEASTNKDGNDDLTPFIYQKNALWQFIGEIQENRITNNQESSSSFFSQVFLFVR